MVLPPSDTRAAQIYLHSSDERRRKLADVVGRAARATLGITGTASGPGVAREIITTRDVGDYRTIRP